MQAMPSKLEIYVNRYQEMLWKTYYDPSQELKYTTVLIYFSERETYPLFWLSVGQDADFLPAQAGWVDAFGILGDLGTNLQNKAVLKTVFLFFF